MRDYPVFTPEMKKTHTILVPDMLPIHFKLIISVFKKRGYKFELLQTSTRSVIDEGLKNVHNDTCYPALLVIGQFMEALKSGRYNPDTTALMLSQTGGGCRASNYIYLLRKALKEQFPQVPVISLNFSGLEKDGSFEIDAPMFMSLLTAVIMGDLLMSVYNQCRPYELSKGASEKILNKWERRLGEALEKGKSIPMKQTTEAILKDFDTIDRSHEQKTRVGIVGEIYVKYSPLANNHLEDFLLSEGCEPVVPSLLEFVLYCAVTTVVNGKLYGFKNKKTFAFGLGYKYLYAKQKQLIKIMKEHGKFDPPHDFEHLRHIADELMSEGVSMGEGWLIPAEMAALAESGTKNIICAQPFGCLPNHIVAKGMSRTIKNKYSDANVVAVDYDPGATKVNQENRIKLMLALAKHK